MGGNIAVIWQPWGFALPGIGHDERPERRSTDDDEFPRLPRWEATLPSSGSRGNSTFQGLATMNVPSAVPPMMTNSHGCQMTAMLPPIAANPPSSAPSVMTRPTKTLKLAPALSANHHLLIVFGAYLRLVCSRARSEERRVGKEC